MQKQEAEVWATKMSGHVRAAQALGCRVQGRGWVMMARSAFIEKVISQSASVEPLTGQGPCEDRQVPLSSGCLAVSYLPFVFQGLIVEESSL